MTIAARLHDDQSADRRGSPRRRLSLDLTLEASGHQVSIHDISSTGMLIETSAGLVPFDGLEIDLPEAGITRAVVIWNSGPFFGCEFREPLSRAGLSAAVLRAFPPSTAQLQLPLAAEDSAAVRTDLAEDIAAFDAEKPPLGMRLSLILRSAIILWALILRAVLWPIRRAHSLRRGPIDPARHSAGLADGTPTARRSPSGSR